MMVTAENLRIDVRMEPEMRDQAAVDHFKIEAQDHQIDQI